MLLIINQGIIISSMTTTDNDILNSAIAYFQQGHLQEAERFCNQLLTQNASDPKALCLSGMIAGQRKHTELAVALIQKAITISPKNAYFQSNLGLVLEEAGDIPTAIAHYQKALALDKNCVDAMINLALALQNQNELAKAKTWYEKALKLEPNSADLLNNFGSLLLRQNKSDEAQQKFRKALHLSPDSINARFNLATAYRQAGQYEKALETLNILINSNPHLTEAHLQIALVHKLKGNNQGALAAYKQASDLDSSCLLAHMRLGAISDIQGDLKTAQLAYQRLMTAEPNNPFWPLRLNSMFDSVPANQEAIQTHRTQVMATLKQLATWPHTEHTTDLLESFALPSFYWLYHGVDDTALRCQFADWIQAQLPPDDYQPSCLPLGNRKIKIGFVCTENRDTAFWLFLQGFLKHLNRHRFALVVAAVGETAHVLKSHLQSIPDVTFVPLPLGLCEMVATLREQALDVLYYVEVGTDPKNYFLPFYRIAPVQCTTWGIPVTTGISNMDYYLSSQWFEPDDAQCHYREKLVQFETLPLYYIKPDIPEILKTRADLGLPEDKRLYSCPHNLSKFHPEFDAYLAGILSADPDGLVVIPESPNATTTQLLKNRMQQAIRDVYHRIHFLPFLPRLDYLSLMHVSNVLLDPLHFSGGITSYEAFAMACPVVTQPGAFMRGRFTAAMYGLMGITECIAQSQDDYIATALRLATDPSFRTVISQKIEAKSALLYENPQTIQELEQFLIQAVADAQR